MIDHEIRQDDGILVLRPHGPLAAADFTAVASLVDTYLEHGGKLHGVFISAKSFPGWKDFAGLLAHLKFVKAHHRDIQKVAIVADGAMADLMPGIVGRFVHAQLQHFDPGHEDAAWAWLRQGVPVPPQSV